MIIAVTNKKMIRDKECHKDEARQIRETFGGDNRRSNQTDVEAEFDDLMYRSQQDLKLFESRTVTLARNLKDKV